MQWFALLGLVAALGLGLWFLVSLVLMLRGYNAFDWDWEDDDF